MARFLGLLLPLVLALPPAAMGLPDEIPAATAKDFIGKRMTVCGKVVQIQKGFNRTERSFLLHLDTVDPRPVFTVILGGSRMDSPFWNVEKTYPGKSVCATGYIRDRGTGPYMQLTQPSEIRIAKTE